MDSGDRKQINKAFEFAYEAHKGIRRKSNEPYIIHPIAVAKIAAEEIGLGPTAVISALLHDVVEDTDYTNEDIENIFGKKIATIVDGLTKLSGVFEQDTSMQAENFKKLLLTLSDDVRVILIKLADRLHNMRTLDSLPPNKQLKMAGETIYIFAPLAHRLGLYAIKTELEDLSFKYGNPKMYSEIGEKINLSKKNVEEQISHFIGPIKEQLEAQKFTFQISGRHKSIYSVWNKMQQKNVPFEEIYDLFAIRIVFGPKPELSEKNQCWDIYSLITDIYRPKPDRIRDWLSIPKVNGYEALHLTVMGPDGKWVEVQIRSTRMNEIAERGYAAHWEYKGNFSQEDGVEGWLKRMRELLQSPESNALEFLDDFRMNLFASEIIVFTPKGDMKVLPKSSSVLDFAYEIHSMIGNKCIGAKVNHNLVDINYLLKSGDQVEILTSEKQKPQPGWLENVTTAKAKASIKDALKTERKELIRKGQEMLDAKVKELKLHLDSRIFKKMMDHHKLINKDDLYYKIAREIINLDNLDKIIKKKSSNKFIRYWKLQIFGTGSKKQKQIVQNELHEQEHKINKEIPYILDDETGFELAKCCKPIPGDEIIGFLKKDTVVQIHKSNCPLAMRLVSSQGDTIIKAKWTTYKIISFLAKISIAGIDRLGIANEITKIITEELSVNMRSINIESHSGIFEGTIDVYVHNKEDLENLLKKLRGIKGLETVRRVENLDEHE
jgi:GTP pyrophosphokinase